MTINVTSDRLVVISDLHLGNPYCETKDLTLSFLRWASEEGYDICINGDGLEIAQVSFARLARDVPDALMMLRTLLRAGSRIYYVVGNHDIALENFLNDWGQFIVSPFLNLESGGKRVRIEHGHLYDPFFIRHPRLYEMSTEAGGLLLRLHPGFYQGWMRLERFQSLRRARRGEAIVGESPAFAEAAREISHRGFDAVVFGHTHHVGRVDLGGGATYVNPGSWLLGTHYVEIIQGEVRLREWLPDERRGRPVDL